jgi:hypothetical protein
MPISAQSAVTLFVLSFGLAVILLGVRTGVQFALSMVSIDGVDVPGGDAPPLVGIFADDSEEFNEDLRPKLVAFFRKHNPSKLASIDDALAKYGNDVKALNAKLVEKYHADLDSDKLRATAAPKPRPRRPAEERANPPPLRERLHAFFSKYNPPKLSSIDEALARHGADEAGLNAKLREKYGADLDSLPPPLPVAAAEGTLSAFDVQQAEHAAPGLQEDVAAAFAAEPGSAPGEASSAAAAAALLPADPLVMCVGLMNTGCEEFREFASHSLGLESASDEQQALRLLPACTEPSSSSPDFSVFPEPAVVGLGSSLFFEELLGVYPGMKVVLAVRDVDAWWSEVRSLRLSEQFRCSGGGDCPPQLACRRMCVDWALALIPASRRVLMHLGRGDKAVFARLAEWLGVRAAGSGTVRRDADAQRGAAYELSRLHVPAWGASSTPGSRLKIFVVGLEATGTAGVFAALKSLGYVTGPFDASIRAHCARSDLSCQTSHAMLDAARRGLPLDVPTVFEHVEAAGGRGPAHSWLAAVVAAAPDCKVVLTVRRIEDWLGALACAKAPAGQLHGGRWTGAGGYALRRRYQDFVDHVARTVPPSRLLVLDPALPSAWERLCVFVKSDARCSARMLQAKFPVVYEDGCG